MSGTKMVGPFLGGVLMLLGVAIVFSQVNQDVRPGAVLAAILLVGLGVLPGWVSLSGARRNKAGKRQVEYGRGGWREVPALRRRT